MDKASVYRIPFASVYPLYIQKAEKKGRTKAEVDAIIFWLTGYNSQTLQQQIDRNSDLEAFFAQAPQLNPNANRIPQISILKATIRFRPGELMPEAKYL